MASALGQLSVDLPDPVELPEEEQSEEEDQGEGRLFQLFSNLCEELKDMSDDVNMLAEKIAKVIDTTAKRV